MTKERIEAIRSEYENAAVLYQKAFNAGEKEEYEAIKALSDLAANIPILLIALESSQATAEQQQVRIEALEWKLEAETKRVDQMCSFLENGRFCGLCAHEKRGLGNEPCTDCEIYYGASFVFDAARFASDAASD